ncbi:MAG: hypothetical protein ACFCUV_16130 [Rivularia sp. (in: cyanobacteria)]
MARATVKAIAPTINQAFFNDRQTIANFMTEGGSVAFCVGITTANTVATIAVSMTSPPKPVFMKIIAAGIGGTILGGIFAALILRHYRKEVLSNNANSRSTIESSKQST